MHVIRLRGPWELTPLGAAEIPPPARTQVPGDGREVLGADFCGRARFVRRFNTPTNLDPDERVWLVVAQLDEQAEVHLNDQPLGPRAGSPTSCRHDITPLLKLHNTLTIETPYPGYPLGEVHLEIGSS